MTILQSIKRTLGIWERCDKPYWIKINNSAGPYSVTFVSGRTFDYKCIGSFRGEDIDSRCYRKLRH